MASIKISGLPEQSTAAEDDYLVFGKDVAMKIPLSALREVINAPYKATLLTSSDTIASVAQTVPEGETRHFYTNGAVLTDGPNFGYVFFTISRASNYFMQAITNENKLYVAFTWRSTISDFNRSIWIEK